MSADAYQESGEFLDVLSQDMWSALRDPVVAALRGAVPAAGPLLDVGAGSGIGTLIVAGALPEAEILAIEPSTVQRAALLARIVADPSLRRRITVVAAGADDAVLPDRLGAVLAMNMIGHLKPDQRRAFWRRVSQRLPPGAPLVLNLQLPPEPVTVPETAFATPRVGRYRYEGSGDAEPAGPDSVTWRMRYRVLDPDGHAVREMCADYEWYVLSWGALRDELADAGLSAEIGALDVVRAVPAR